MLTAVTCLTNTFSMKQQIILLQQHRKSLSTSALTLETKKKLKSVIMVITEVRDKTLLQ